MDQIKGPHIFVAYSWDSLPHKGKVKKLVQRLRLDGIDVAVLDYGMLYSLEDFIKFISIFQFYTGPVYEYLPLRDIIDGQRKKFYPNTYGISILEAELTMDLISNYTWFDSYSLRDRS